MRSTLSAGILALAALLGWIVWSGDETATAGRTPSAAEPERAGPSVALAATDRGPGPEPVARRAVEDEQRPGTQDVLVASEAATLRGRVLDPTGEPASGFTAVLFSIGWGEGRGLFPLQQQHGREGGFVFRDVPAGRFEIEVLRYPLAAAPLRVDVVAPESRAETEAADPPQELDLTIRLLGPGSLAGVVLDPAGQPVRGARVGVGANRTATDGAGRFLLRAVQAGRVTVVAQSAAHASAEPLVLDLASGEMQDDLVLRLGEAASMAGTFRTAEGEPLAGAAVTFAALGPGDQVDVFAHEPHRALTRGSTVTDALGHFRFAAVQPGRVEVQARAVVVVAADGEERSRLHATVEAEAEAPAGETTQVELVAPSTAGTLTVRVAGFTPELAGLRFELVPAGVRTSTLLVSGEVDATGTAQLPLPALDAPLRLRLFPPPDQGVGSSGKTAGGAPPTAWPAQALTLHPDAGFDASRPLVLCPPTARLGGRVVAAEDRRGLASVQVRLDREDLERPRACGHALLRISGVVLTGPDGAFAFEGLAPGRYRLRLPTSPDGVLVDVEAGAAVEGLELESERP